MENNEQESFLQMHLDYDGGNILRETVRWSRFLSIVGIVGLAICLLAVVLAGPTLISTLSRMQPALTSLEGLGGAILIIAVLVVFAVFGFLVYMLYRFSVLTRRGIEQQDQALFSKGMKCLKFYFLVTGILALLGLLSNLLSITTLFHS